MGSEEFYDSLDEDSSYGSLNDESLGRNSSFESVNTKKSLEDFNMNVNLTQNPKEIYSSNEDIPDDEIIPYYDGNFCKSKVDLNSIASNCDLSSCILNVKKKKKKIWKTSVVIKEKLKSRSYLNMFHARMGIPNKSPTESSRATCLELTPKSFKSCESFEINPVFLKNADMSDTESVYEGSIETDQKKIFASSIISLDSKLCSVSEQNMNNSFKKQTRKKRSSNSFPIKVPELGRLGPDISKDKLELLKKRQQYGQKVSQTNKIKMLETKVLQDLRQEIKISKNIS